MPRIGLLEPLLDGGVRHAHFFNGRVLTAEALAEDRAALHRHAERLGRAVGEGVAFGLAVAAGPVRSGVPTVEVAPGLAVNRKGQTLAIADEVGPVEVALGREAVARALPEGTGAFEACRSGGRLRDDGFQAKLDPGPYVLAIGPLSAFEGRVPGVGAGGDGVAGFCGSQYETEGVYLRLVSLDLDAEIARVVREGVRSARLADRVRARNVLAHACLGTPDLGAIRAAPRTAGARYGLLDAMRDDGSLDACEVPLALVYWDETALRFVDAWAARRRLAEDGASDAWRLHASPRRVVEAEAAFLQFQAQVQEVRATGGFRLDAVEAFRYLPAAGYVPSASEDVFFERLDVRRRLRADEAFLRRLLHDSFYTDPLDLQANPPPAVDVYALPSSDLVLFVRSAEVEAVERPVEPDLGTGDLVVEVVLNERSPTLVGTEAVAIRGIRGVDTESVLDQIDKRLAVTASRTDARSGTVTGRLDKQSLKRILAEAAAGRGERTVEALTYTFPPLPPGEYAVRLRGEGIREQSAQPEVAAEATTRVPFQLLPAKTKTPGEKPPTRVDVGDLRPNWFEEAYLDVPLLDAYATWPWPPEDPSRYEHVEEVPPDLAGFLDDWGDVVRERYPEAPVASDVRLYLDLAYAPDGTPPDVPYAYAAYGESGAYVPLVLLPPNRTLGHPVGIGKSGLFGGDTGIERRLGEVGADEVDVLANAWGGLVQDVTGVGAEAARRVVAGARSAVDDLQDGLLQFTGVTPDLAATLTQAGFGTPTDLANASAAAILDALGENAGPLTPAWAELLVGEARRAVPSGAWSLDAMDLDRSLRTALEGAGVRSLGDLGRVDAEAVAEAAGVSAEAVRTVAEDAAGTREEAATRVVRERQARAPVSGVEGIERSAAVALARSGLASTGDLADANAAVVARTLGVDEAAAQRLVTNARTRLGR